MCNVCVCACVSVCLYYYEEYNRIKHIILYVLIYYNMIYVVFLYNKRYLNALKLTTIRTLVKKKKKISQLSHVEIFT